VKKIDLSNAPTGSGTRYPQPHNAPCLQRQWLKLADAAGLTQFGVNLVTLAPGVWSSQRHWHTHEDEFIYVLEGELVLHTNAGEELLHAGDCAGFKAGVEDGHCLKNLSSAPAKFLAIGTRLDQDHGEYSDIDMKFLPNRYSGAGGFTRKDGSAFE
jgi:uncharacterized cupin superfamily protein